MQLGIRAPCLPACPHRAVISRKAVDQPAQPHLGSHLPQSAAGLAAARRGSLLCAAAKRPNAKKKAVQKGKPKGTVKDRPQVPDAAPAKGSTSTRERSDELQAEEQTQERQQQELQQQHEQSQQAEADVEGAGQPEQEPVQAATRQPAELPSAPADAGYAQHQEQALSEARDPEGNAAELRRLMQQKQQSEQKPNFLQGVLQEVQLIEWPSISSVLLNTVLVFAIVAGFSVLLFAVNTLLAETSQALYGGLRNRPQVAASSEPPASQLPVPTAPELAEQPQQSAPAPQPPTKTYQDLGPE